MPKTPKKFRQLKRKRFHVAFAEVRIFRSWLIFFDTSHLGTDFCGCGGRRCLWFTVAGIPVLLLFVLLLVKRKKKRKASRFNDCEAPFDDMIEPPRHGRTPVRPQASSLPLATAGPTAGPAVATGSELGAGWVQIDNRKSVQTHCCIHL